jgi:MFS family permease
MFTKLKHEGLLKSKGTPIIGTLRYNWYKILILAWIPVIGTLVATTFSAYVPLYLETSAMHFKTPFVYTLTTISSAAAVILTIVMAYLSDVLGRKLTILITITVGTWIFAIPAMLLLLPSLNSELLIIMSVIFSSLVLSAFGAYPAVFAESFDTKYRYTASGLTHQMNNVYGGLMFAFLFPYLLKTYGIGGSVTPLAVTFIVVSIISLGALLWAKETKGITMT